MKRLLRIALIGAVSLVVLFAIAAGVALFVVNPNDYKPRIEAAAMEATGKKLQLQGDLTLSLFPTIRIESGPAFIGDDPSFGEAPFLSVRKISASVALLPLFSGKTEIEDVEIAGLRLKLAVDEKGASNWSMPGKPPGKPPEKSPRESPGPQQSAPSAKTAHFLSSIALDSLSLTDAVISYANIPAQTDIEIAIEKLGLQNVGLGRKSTLNLTAAVEKLFPEPAALALSASFSLPATPKEGSRIAAEGTFAGIPFSFQGFAALSEEISLKGEASFGDIDCDKFTAKTGAPGAKKTTGNAARPAAGKPGSESGGDIAETLRSLSLDLSIKARSVTAANIPVKNIKALVKADRGVITANPVSCDVFGPVSAEAGLDARGPAVKFRTAGKLENIAAGQLVKAAGGKIPLTGTLNAAWDVNATGLSWPSASKSLNGAATVEFSNGDIPAFQLIPAGVPNLPAMTLDLKDVRSTSTWNIADGIASNNDMTVRAALISGNGKGNVNIPAERIDYTMNVSIPAIKELPDLKILPVVISGPLASPSYRIDQSAVLKQTVKSVLDPSTKVGKEVKKGVGKALRKIF